MARIKTAIPAEILAVIKEKEKSGHERNITRFYSYLERQGGNVAISTVAVKDGKAFKGKKETTKFIKKVVVCLQGETTCHCRDIYFIQMGGYIAEFIKEKKLDTKTKRFIVNEYNENWWETSNKYFRLYSKANLINPEFLQQTEEFKYCAWDGYGDLMDYLNTYAKFPKTEFLSKLLGSRFAFSKNLVKKLNTDKQFVKWLSKNKKELKEIEIPALLSAYRNRAKWSIKRARAEYECEKYFRKRQFSAYGYGGYTLLQRLYHESPEAEQEKIWSFIVRNETTPNHYCDYLTALDELGVDRSDTKNTFPIDWQYWQRVRIDQRATLRAEKDAKRFAELTKKIKKVAEKYSSLSYVGENYTIIIADSKSSLIYEGESLSHCVGRMNYDQKISREQSLICFVRKIEDKETPFVTVEFSLEEKRVLQCYGHNDTKPDFAVVDFVDKWAEKAKRKVEAIQRKVA